MCNILLYTNQDAYAIDQKIILIVYNCDCFTIHFVNKNKHTFICICSCNYVLIFMYSYKYLNTYLCMVYECLLHD